MAKKQSDVKEEKVIDIKKGDVVVVGTDKSPFLKTGKDYIVSSEHAKTLIKKGAATLK